MPLRARTVAAASACGGLALNTIPIALRRADTGGVSEYAFHGCSQCDRVPNLRSSSCEGSTGLVPAAVQWLGHDDERAWTGAWGGRWCGDECPVTSAVAARIVTSARM